MFVAVSLSNATPASVDIPALYNPDGHYGLWNVALQVSYGIGVLVQIPFLAQVTCIGPVTQWLRGADISWIVVTMAVYYLWARPPTGHRPRPSARTATKLR
jgi:purine-cytosine permease-like protein